jgi:predicted MFS family arabinose efflux permease
LTDPQGIKQKHILVSSCGAHLVQDGLVALQYVLLPIVAQQFNLGYTQVGFLRAVGHSTMTVLEMPAGILAEKWGQRRLLCIGLVFAGAGYLGVALSPDFFTIAFSLAVAGAGAGFQHSLSSSLLVGCFDGASRRRALGAYNSSGDAGKLIFTAMFSAGMGMGMSWNALVMSLSLVSIIFGMVVWKLLQVHESGPCQPDRENTPASSTRNWGVKSPVRFAILATVVFMDSLVQAVFLTFLAFIMLDKGVGDGLVSVCVVIALVGGMLGKFGCGYCAGRYGDRRTFVVVQLLTVAGLVLLLELPANQAIVALPLIGLVVQGSSTVTYGSVADFVDPDRQSRGYALIYTFSSISTVCGPLLFGMIADSYGLEFSIGVLAVVAALTIPPGWVLSSSRATPVNA